MKILFAGPSIADCAPDLSGITLRPPAAHGDLAQAVLDGATAIGLVDGLFDAVAAVWHKEILFALDRGVRVLGASSMGALRVAECAAFGMQPVGDIAQGYLDGSRDDDADVCLVHGPAELGYAPLSEPIVDIEATLARLVALGEIIPETASAALASAHKIFFADRTLPRFLPPALLELYQAHRVRLKQRDALLLIDRLKNLPETLAPPPDWHFEQSPMWRRRVAALGGITPT